MREKSVPVITVKPHFEPLEDQRRFRAFARRRHTNGDLAVRP